MKLWEYSVHAHKENMFVFDIEKQEFGVKAMNCPGHCLIFNNRVRSYKELPLRLADFGVLHRNEPCGSLSGLSCVRRFQEDDGHIFCRKSQIKEEIKSAPEFVDLAYNIFGFTYELKLSRRPEKYCGDLERWERAESALTEAFNECGMPWEIHEAESVFCGPKIDISISDAMKRKFQLGRLQLDFQLPQCFNLSYSAEDEGKQETPEMIHRAVVESIERMFAILLEHYEGKWPFWLSHRQAIVCPVSHESQAYGFQVKDDIEKAGFFVDIDISERTIEEKVRAARLARYNYVLVVGEKEAETEKVCVINLEEHLMSISDLLVHLNEENEAFR